MKSQQGDRVFSEERGKKVKKSFETPLSRGVEVILNQIKFL